MSPVLSALADRYRHSKAGREGSTQDFLADYRELLQAAGCGDGDARARAEEDLRRAVLESGGQIMLDLHPRDPAIIHRVRLPPGAEAWLFLKIGQIPPMAKRQELAGFFRLRSGDAVPHPGWRPWLETLAEAALTGRNVQPFERDDILLNEELLRVTTAILNWPEESLIRYASAVICRDSKRLEVLHARLLQALRAITGDEAASLEHFQILQVPRAVLCHGPLRLDLPGGAVDFGRLAGPFSVSGTDLEGATAVGSTAGVCLTIENEGVFRELAKRNPGILLVHTSFPGAATRCLLGRLPREMVFFHFGDSDPAGFDILRDLRQKSGRPFQSVGMGFRPLSPAPTLTGIERGTLQRLLDCSLMQEERPVLEAMLRHDSKGDFEQESLGARGLYDVLRHIGCTIPPQVFG